MAGNALWQQSQVDRRERQRPCSGVAQEIPGHRTGLPRNRGSGARWRSKKQQDSIHLARCPFRNPFYRVASPCHSSSSSSVMDATEPLEPPPPPDSNSYSWGRRRGRVPQTLDKVCGDHQPHPTRPFASPQSRTTRTQSPPLDLPGSPLRTLPTTPALCWCPATARPPPRRPAPAAARPPAPGAPVTPRCWPTARCPPHLAR